MTLALVGAGPGPGMMTRRAVELIREADTVYIESYTMPSSSWLVVEVRRLRPDAQVADRTLLEEDSGSLLSQAQDRLVVVAVAGDPLIATTHRALVSEARRRGLEVTVVPGVSGVCAAKTAAGLDYYKYGRTATIPGPWRMVKPYSVVEYTLENMCIGLHTLLLLDVAEDGGQLPLGQAWRMLREAGAPRLLAERLALVVVDAGTERERVYYSRLEDIGSHDGHGGVASIVVPGNVSPVEAEHLQALHGVDEDMIPVGDARRMACSTLEEYRRWLETV